MTSENPGSGAAPFPTPLPEKSASSDAPENSHPASLDARRIYLYENQGIDFDDVRAALRRLFGPEHSATIHDGDGCTLFDRMPGYYAAGTINDPSDAPVATFAIDYVTEEAADGEVRRHVVGVHIGPRGQWCRTQADLDVYNDWLDELSPRHPLPRNHIQPPADRPQPR